MRIHSGHEALVGHHAVRPRGRHRSELDSRLLALEVIEYHYTETLLNQAIGLDATALVLVAPLALFAGILTLRGHPAGPVLAFAPSTFAAYMMPQYSIGPDYLGLPGNNEDFFALHFGLFALSAAIIVMAWSLSDFTMFAPSSKRFDRVAGIALFLLPAFMILGLYVPGFVDALSGEPSRDEYLDNPTAFWIIAFLDLAIVAPAAIASGVGCCAAQRGRERASMPLRAGSRWCRRQLRRWASLWWPTTIHWRRRAGRSCSR